MDWQQWESFRQTDAAKDAARSAKQTQAATAEAARAAASTEEAAWATARAQEDTAQAARQAAAQAAIAREEQREYQFKMWLQTPDGEYYAAWKHHANLRLAKLDRLNQTWTEAWQEAARLHVGPPPTRAEIDDLKHRAYVAGSGTLWCAGLGLVGVLFSALFLHTGLVFWPAALVLLVGAPVCGFLALKWKRANPAGDYTRRAREALGLDPFHDELPPWDDGSTGTTAFGELDHLLTIVATAPAKLPTDADLPALDRVYRIRPAIQAPHPVPETLEHLRRELDRMTQPL